MIDTGKPVEKSMRSIQEGEESMSEKELFDRWRVWHSGLDSDTSKQQFNNWYELCDRHKALEALAGKYAIYSSPRFNEARQELKIAAKRLDMKEPYRVIILGETGAGKSTFVNALIGRNLLLTGAGAAITGAATYITFSRKVEKENARIIYRDDNQFKALLNSMAKRYNLSIADSPEAILKSVSQPDSNIFKSPHPEHIQHILLRDIEDIATTWIFLRKNGDLGKPKDFDPVEQREKIHDLISEQEGDNKVVGERRKAEKRIVPGINRLIYTLRPGIGEIKNLQAMEHVNIIDAPGSAGGRTLRHNEILYLETEQADAVIFVVRAERPSGDQSEDVTQLKESLFFTGLPEEQRNKLASKVFIIANRYDQILLKPEDVEKNKARLEDSIKMIAGSIATNYWKLYCLEDSADRRYFRTAALFFEENPSSLEKMEQSSGMSQARARILHFLSSHRLKLALDEARDRLNRADSYMRKAAREFLPKKEGANYAELNAREARLEYIQKLCHEALDHSKKELESVNKQMLKSIDDWRSNDAHATGLADRIENIYKIFETDLQSELKDQQPELVRQIRQDTDGGVITEGLPKNLALEVERRLRKSVVENSDELADYYLNHFDNEVASCGLRRLMSEMTYDQDYIKRLDPCSHLDRELSMLRTNFRSICQWTLLYELIKRPILMGEASQKASRSMWHVLRRTAPELIGLSIESVMVALGVSHLTAEVIKILGIAFFEEKQESASYVEQSASQQILAAQQSVESELVKTDKKLVLEIYNELSADRFDEAGIILLKEFGQRYRSAFVAALPQIESLFSYEASLFSRRCDVLSRNLIELHRSHVRVQPDAPICEILLEQKKVDMSEIDQAINLLIEMEQLNATAPH